MKKYKLTDEIVERYYDYLVEVFSVLSRDEYRSVSMTELTKKYKLNTNATRIIIGLGWIVRISQNQYCKYKLNTEHEPTRRWAVSVLKELQKLNKKYTEKQSKKNVETKVKVESDGLMQTITEMRQQITELRESLQPKKRKGLFTRIRENWKKKKLAKLRKKIQRLEK